MKTLKIITCTLVLSLLFYSCDKNEFAPVIVEQDFAVAENTPEGGAFGTVIASDADVGQRLSYEIVDGNLEDVFDIDGSTGSLLVNDANKLDYESTRHYILQVAVSDNHKKDPLESSANIFIDVTDANEFAPSIPDIENQVFRISENSLAGTVVGVVEASDEDSEQTLTYSIKSGNESGIFTINSENGIITVLNNSTLDYETTRQYLLTVAVSDDHLEDPRESTANMRVDVLDVNEFAPEIESRIFTLDENPLNGQVIGRLEATDGDIHQSLTFSIIEQTENNYFGIDSIRGMLWVADSSGFDFETTEQFTLQVQAIDNHTNPLKETVTVTVNVSNVLEITEGLIAYYPFNGNANDENGNGIDGQVNGPAPTTDRHQNPESAYLFDGVNDFINLTNSQELHFGNQDFSISVWYELSSLDIKPQDIISVYSSSGSNREFRIATNPAYDNMYAMLFDNGGSAGDQIKFPKKLGWQHVTITKSATTLSLYVNGSLHSEIPVTASISTTNSRAIIGAVDKSTTSPDSFFDGKIDDIYIHSRVLVADEVLQIFQLK